MATTAKIAKEAEDAEVQGSPAQPLPPVRPAARLHAQVRAVPPLLPQAGARRRRHGGDQEQLVENGCEVPRLECRVRTRRLSSLRSHAPRTRRRYERYDRSNRRHAHADPQRGDREAHAGRHARLAHQGGHRADSAGRRLHPGLQAARRGDGRRRPPPSRRCGCSSSTARTASS